MEPGTTLEFRAPSSRLQNEIESWLAEQPSRRTTIWQNESAAPLQWEFDKLTYTPSRLARRILTEAAGRTSSIQGPLCWITADDRTLVDLARELPPGGAAPIQEHP